MLTQASRSVEVVLPLLCTASWFPRHLNQDLCHSILPCQPSWLNPCWYTLPLKLNSRSSEHQSTFSRWYSERSPTKLTVSVDYSAHPVMHGMLRWLVVLAICQSLSVHSQFAPQFMHGPEAYFLHPDQIMPSSIPKAPAWPLPRTHVNSFSLTSSFPISESRTMISCLALDPLLLPSLPNRSAPAAVAHLMPPTSCVAWCILCYFNHINS